MADFKRFDAAAIEFLLEVVSGVFKGTADRILVRVGKAHSDATLNRDGGYSRAHKTSTDDPDAFDFILPESLAARVFETMLFEACSGME